MGTSIVVAPPILDEAVAELRALGVLRMDETECVQLTGGTESTVAAVGRPGGPEHVVKLSPVAGRIATEGAYLSAYQSSPLLARLRYADPGGRYLVYGYIDGARLPQHCPGVDKAATLVTLAQELLNHYRPVTEVTSHSAAVEQPGGPLALAWQPGFLQRLSEARRRFGDYLPVGAEALAGEMAEISQQHDRAQTPCLLHGDAGPHNFLFDGTTLTAVIDPLGYAGQPIYDLARAFAAWPGDFTIETLLPAANALHSWRQTSRRALVGAVIPPLFGQVTACLWHHPHDIEQYQNAWAYWTTLLADG